MIDWKAKLANGETGVMVHKTYDASVVRKDGLTTFVISTGDVDRHNDTIDPAGWDLAAYRSNPVVLWQHDPYPGPIGSGKNVRLEDGALKAEVEFSKSHPLGIRAAELIEEGHLRAVSVGFRIKEWTYNEERGGGGMDITSAELWEFSPVSIPANARALAERSGSEARAQLLNACSVKMPPDLDLPKDEKAGRVLSKANLDRLRAARGAIDDVIAAAIEDADDDEKSTGPMLEIIL